MDPITLTSIGAIALNEGVKFLYGQASELLKARRERRSSSQSAPPTGGAVEIVVAENERLDQQLGRVSVNLQEIEENADILAALTNSLTPYAQGWETLRLENRAQIEAVEQLRAILEGLYGQRITFRGEDRQPTGTRVDAEQILGTVRGAVSAVRAGTVGRGTSIHSRQQADEVAEGATLIGLDAEKME